MFDLDFRVGLKKRDAGREVQTGVVGLLSAGGPRRSIDHWHNCGPVAAPCR